MCVYLLISLSHHKKPFGGPSTTLPSPPSSRAARAASSARVAAPSGSMVAALRTYSPQRELASSSHSPRCEGYTQMAKRKKTAASSHVSGSHAFASARILLRVSQQMAT